MKAELKQRWIEALRSGKYTQGTGCLRRGSLDGTMYHCCLGVLAEILDEIEGEHRWRKQEKIHLWNGFTGIINVSVCKRIGLNYEIQGMLTAQNDGEDEYGFCSFEKIADWIEKNVEES